MYKDFSLSTRFINRELSWLLFNERVLQESLNAQNPLFERLRFLAISASNLDEFYAVRLAGLMALIKQNVQRINMRGETSQQQLDLIYPKIRAIMESQQQIWQDLKQELALYDVCVRTPHDLTPEEQQEITDFFQIHIFPLLTPLAIDNAHPFPFIPHQGLAMIFTLLHGETGEKMDMIVPIPMNLKRFYRFNEQKTPCHFITIEEIVLSNIHHLFVDYHLEGYGIFKILRDTDIEIEEDAEDLVREFEMALRKRQKGDVVRLKMMQNMPESLKKLLVNEYELPAQAVIESPYFIGMANLQELLIVDKPALFFPPFTPRNPAFLKDFSGSLFDKIREQPFMLHHPYDSFETVVRFVEEAAFDPEVVGIKMTLYRTSADSPIVKALMLAAENGKHVTAVVELKARFDEAANIRWAKKLEHAGVQVVFGFLEWKTHAKMISILRKEQGELKTYLHIGTGNYHPLTAKIYTDISFFTDCPALGRDSIKIFNFMTGYITPKQMEKLKIAPLFLKEELLRLIRQEKDNALAGKPAFIEAKMNSLVDPDMIEALYNASSAGVRIFLNIRGVCCLRAGVMGLSEHISVKSIVGRFLEHTRLFIFANGADIGHLDNLVFIASADLMPRNLERRIELMTPIEDPHLKFFLMHEVLASLKKDTHNSWHLMDDDSYQKCPPSERFSAVDYFMQTGVT